jgi:hypothetical protein
MRDRVDAASDQCGITEWLGGFDYDKTEQWPLL